MQANKTKEKKLKFFTGSKGILINNAPVNL
jgi:hypothetical protein